MTFLGVLAAQEPETADPLAEKKFSPQWIDSLTQRGAHEVYPGVNIEYIAMPIGGLCDGITSVAMAALEMGYFQPDCPNTAISGKPQKSTNLRCARKTGIPIRQGFALRVTDGSTSQMRRLDKGGFENITFCGEYPMGFVPIKTKRVGDGRWRLSRRSPVNVDDSGMPATVMRFTLQNSGNKRLTRTWVDGWEMQYATIRLNLARASGPRSCESQRR